MKTVIISLVAAISTTSLIVLWFWVVRRELRAKKAALQAARCQLSASKQEWMKARNGPDEAKNRDILERSRSVYSQTVRGHNESLKEPWNYLPGLLLGFRREEENL